MSSQLEQARRFSIEEVVEMLGEMTSYAITGEDVFGSGFSVDLTDSTFLVKYVFARTSAAAGGLEAGDQIVSIDGVMLPDSPTAETLVKILIDFRNRFTNSITDMTKSSGESLGIKISVLRNGERKTLILPRKNTLTSGDLSLQTNFGESAVASGSIGDDGLPDLTIVTNSGGSKEILSRAWRNKKRGQSNTGKKVCSLGFEGIY